jgi:hypothetical protein
MKLRDAWVLQSTSSRRVAGLWFVWSVWFIWFLWLIGARDTRNKPEKLPGLGPMASRGGPLTVFQRNGAITQGRVAATWPNEMIAAGNMSCI